MSDYCKQFGCHVSGPHDHVTFSSTAGLVAECGHAEQIAQLQRELALSRTQFETLKHTIVSVVGGVDYEGFPTSEINYLQRLRILLEKERELATLKAGAR